MTCKHCGATVPHDERHRVRMITVDGIGSFHEHCITVDQVRLLEEKIDDIKRWAIDVGIINVHADHDLEHADA